MLNYIICTNDYIIHITKKRKELLDTQIYTYRLLDLREPLDFICKNKKNEDFSNATKALKSGSEQKQNRFPTNES